MTRAGRALAIRIIPGPSSAVRRDAKGKRLPVAVSRLRHVERLEYIANRLRRNLVVLNEDHQARKAACPVRSKTRPDRAVVVVRQRWSSRAGSGAPGPVQASSIGRDFGQRKLVEDLGRQ